MSARGGDAQIHDAAHDLGSIYQNLQAAYITLAQLQQEWPSPLTEYLRDEKYLKDDVSTFVEAVVLVLEELQIPMQQLAIDANSLSTDLLRVNRGDGFRV